MIMIRQDDKLSIGAISLRCIHVTECQQRYPDRLMQYIQLLQKYPDAYAGFLVVRPSPVFEGMFELLDGHHRFCAYIACGRIDALCVVIEEKKQ